MVTNGQTRQKAEILAKAFGSKVINQITTDNPQQVLLQVKVAQVDKTALKKMGISFLSKGKAAEGFSNMVGAPTGGLSGNLAAMGSLTPLDTVQLGASYFYGGVSATLQALVTKGLAKVLAEPNLLVKSGEEGSFLAGSRIPYAVVATSGGIASSTIVYESVGIKLKFKPAVLENGLINLKIDPAEVSSITGTMAVNGYPIIDTREVRTSVELKDGESLVLAGLLQEDQINTLSKIPLLGDIPYLGALFRTIQNDMKEKELVFFITPKIVKPLAVGATQTLPTDRKLTADEEKELLWMPR
jgi:pilus assembly protein CpaC